MQSSLAESQEIMIALRRSGGERVECAEDAIASRTDAKLASLTLECRLNLIESLYDDIVTPPKTEAVLRVLKSLKPDPVYAAQQKNLADDLAVAISREPLLIKARAQWDTLADVNKIKVLQRIVDIQADLGGFRPAPVTGYSSPARDDGRVQHGFFDPSDQSIHINLHKDANPTDFASIVATVTHENCHNGQSQLRTAYENRSMTDADPRRPMAMIFSTTLRHQTAILARNDYELYKNQPIEIDANAFGMGMQKRLTQGFKPSAIPNGILMRLPSGPPTYKTTREPLVTKR